MITKAWWPSAEVYRRQLPGSRKADRRKEQSKRTNSHLFRDVSLGTTLGVLVSFKLIGNANKNTSGTIVNKSLGSMQTSEPQFGHPYNRYTRLGMGLLR